MSEPGSRSGPDRRKFLAGAALGGAAALGAAPPAKSQTAPAASPVASPAAAARAAAAENARSNAAAEAVPITVSDPGSDFMVNVLKTLDLEYVAVNPGGSIRGLHEFDHSLWEKHQARTDLRHARGDRRRHMPRLCARRRQTDGGADLWHHGPQARRHGGLQRLCRSRADLYHGRQCGRPEQAVRAAELVSQRHRSRAAPGGLAQMGRSAGVGALYRRFHAIRLPPGVDAANGARARHVRRLAAGKLPDRAARQALDTGVPSVGCAGRRAASARRSGEDARRRAISGHRGGAHGQRAGRHGQCGEARGTARRARAQPRVPHLHRHQSSAQPHRRQFFGRSESRRLSVPRRR